MYLSSKDIFDKLSSDLFLNENLKIKMEGNCTTADMRVGGFYCSFQVPEGDERVIKIIIKNDYSKKLIKELFVECEKTNFYHLFPVERNIIQRILRFINSYKVRFELNDLSSILKSTYEFLFENIVKLNSVFRMDDAISTAKNTQIAFDIRESLSHKYADMMQTMNLIADKGLSIARYGDGELNLVCNINRHTDFQRNSFEINHKLSEILASSQSNLLVCLPIISLHEGFWRDFWFKQWYLFSHHCKLPLYGTAQITRPIFFKLYGLDAVQAWKKLWRGKRVCFVYGEGSRFEKDHFLFDEIIDHVEVLGKAKNAFEDIDTLISESIALRADVDIYLIALGQTGTILASELAKRGVWALDIGHLPNSYDTIFKNKARPESLPLVKK